MYNSLARLQNVFGFFTTVAFTLGVLIAATDLFAARTPTGVIKPTNTQVFAASQIPSETFPACTES